ncbi:hypothetical protein ABT369_47975 [Dactylosporangium sp. NPDC000244]|uniref:hypothetical protein n=1 Tax=Dactylosporangium sp. NPDC000244 TaxID=3154365 RepID=UPI0033301254
MTRPGSGAVREFKDLLHGLYVEAGRPAFAAVAEHARSVAARFGAAHGPTRTAIGAMLRGDSGLPSEQYAVIVGAALARAAGRDPSAAGETVRAAWRTARAATRTLHGRRPGIPVSEADPATLDAPATSSPDETDTTAKRESDETDTATKHGSDETDALDTTAKRESDETDTTAKHGSDETDALDTTAKRQSDETAARIVAAARSGASRILALVGPPGPARARPAWTAVRSLPGLWRLWRPERGAALDAAGPYTVIWLADAAPRVHVDAALERPGLLAQVLARLRDPDRAPVLIVLPLWPADWARLTAPPPPGTPDTPIRPLLRDAGVLTPQTPIPAPALDPGRFGGTAHPGVLPPGPALDAGRFSGAAVPEHAPHNGATRQATEFPPGPALDAAIDAWRFGGTVDPAVPEHALYDGAIRRAAVFPPAPFWAGCADRTIGEQAERRGRYARAAQVYRLAAARGDTTALVRLAMLRERAGDPRGAARLAIAAAERGDGLALRRLAVLADDRGDAGRADALARAAAANGDPELLCELARRQPQRDPTAGTTRAAAEHASVPAAGTTRAEALYRAAAEHASVPAAGALALISHERGEDAEAERFARRAAAGGDTTALRRLADLHRRAAATGAAGRPGATGATAERSGAAAEPSGATAGRSGATAERSGATAERSGATAGRSGAAAERCAVTAASYGHAAELHALRDDQRRLGKAGAVAALRQRTADITAPGARHRLDACLAISVTRALAMALRLACARHTGPLRGLAVERFRRGEHADGLRLAVIAGRYGDPSALADIAVLTAAAGRAAEAEDLAGRAAVLGDGSALRRLARQRRRGGDADGAVRLLERAVASGDPDALFDLGRIRQHQGDAAAAEEHFRDAARRGVADAASALVRLLHRDDPAAAGTYARRAAELGHTAALVELGSARAAAGDVAGAVTLLRLAVERGDDAAAQCLAPLDDAAGHPAVLRHRAALRDRQGRAAEAEALRWAAYEGGDAEALSGLAHMRAEDDGEPDRAERLAVAAARDGHPRAVDDLCALRAMTGDLAGAERLGLRARPANLAPLIARRLATDEPPAVRAAPLYAHAPLVLARIHPDRGEAYCVRAANLGDPAALPELARLHRSRGDRVTAEMVERYGLDDDGAPAQAW